jgi:hypothetical protein
MINSDGVYLKIFEETLPHPDYVNLSAPFVFLLVPRYSFSTKLLTVPEDARDTKVAVKSTKVQDLMFVTPPLPAELSGRKIRSNY